MENKTDLLTPEAARLINEAREFLETGVSLVTIETETQYIGAAALIKELKTKKKTLDETRATEKEPHLTAGRAVDAEFQPIIKLFDEKITLIERAGRSYRETQERIRAEEQKRLLDQAEARRRKLEEQAGTNAEKAASLRQMAQDYRSHAAVSDNTEEVSRLTSEAAKCEMRALKYDEKVEAKTAEIAVTVAPVVAPVVPKATRGAFNVRAYYGARVTNLDQLLDYVKQNRQYHLITVNQSALDQLATVAKGATSAIPGVQFFKKA